MEKASLTTLKKKVGGRSWNFWKNVGNDRKKWGFSNKRVFSTMFFSKRLECISFDKLLENLTEISRKKFAPFSEFARITSFFSGTIPTISSGQLKRSFDNPAETFWRKFKNLQRKVRETMEDGFFSRKVPGNFSARDLECSFDQFVEKILSEVWETLSFSQIDYLFSHILLWPMI